MLVDYDPCNGDNCFRQAKRNCAECHRNYCMDCYYTHKCHTGGLSSAKTFEE